MEVEIPAPLRKANLHQSGVVSRAQALQAGLSPDKVKFRVSSGRWQQIHPGVYATFSGTPDRRARLWAAVLSAGRGAVLSHETAAELHRLTDRPAGLIHVTVPARRKAIAPEGITIHRSNRAGELALEHSNPPRTSVEETVLDLTQTAANFDDVCGWVTRAIARNLTDEKPAARGDTPAHQAALAC